jgi:hypothetical protein
VTQHPFDFAERVERGLEDKVEPRLRCLGPRRLIRDPRSDLVPAMDAASGEDLVHDSEEALGIELGDRYPTGRRGIDLGATHHGAEERVAEGESVLRPVGQREQRGGLLEEGQRPSIAG